MEEEKLPNYVEVDNVVEEEKESLDITKSIKIHKHPVKHMKVFFSLFLFENR
jgi:hypothetical protein